MLEYERGEALARLCLEKKGYKVIDRRNSPEYWRQDIDFSSVSEGKC